MTHPTPTGDSLTLTDEQADTLGRLIRHTLDAQYMGGVCSVNTPDDLDQETEQFHDLSVLWRALDAGRLPAGDPAIRRALQRELEYWLLAIVDDMCETPEDTTPEAHLENLRGRGQCDTPVDLNRLLASVSTVKDLRAVEQLIAALDQVLT